MSWTIHTGGALEVLREMEDESVQCCVTSPPYWGLRDYGCDGQIGLEETPEAYVEALVEVFREVRRVLRDDGTLWLNLGDSYAGSWGAQSREHAGKHAPNISALSANQVKAAQIRESGTGSLSRTPGLKRKDLVGIPWRVAFALQADGWYLRSDIIWHKPNPMPESVTDRPTKAHEYLFLLSKSERYYYDTVSSAEMAVSADSGPGVGGWASGSGPHDAMGFAAGDRGDVRASSHGAAVTERKTYRQRNRRTVWTIPTQAFPGAHFATFPEALVEPCVLAGSREGDMVLDPFAGAGTVGVVCRLHRRRFIGIELNPEYAELARGRLGADEPRVSNESTKQGDLFS